MPRRPFCDGSHDWAIDQSRRHEGAWKCVKCPAIFPCRERCSHTDCEEATGRTALCPVCKKEVKFEDGFHFSPHGKLTRVCDGPCREKFEARVPQEDEMAEAA